MIWNTGEIDKLPPKIKRLLLSNNEDDHNLGLELCKSFPVDIETIEYIAACARCCYEDPEERNDWWEYYWNDKEEDWSKYY